MKAGKIILSILIFIFIFSLLAWSVPVWGAEKEALKDEERVFLENLKKEIFDASKFDISLEGIAVPSRLPVDNFYFLNSLTGWLKGIFLFNKAKKIEFGLNRASLKLFEIREMILLSADDGEIKKGLEKYLKADKKIKNRLADFVLKDPAVFLNNDLDKKIVDSFVGWQKMIGEISFLLGEGEEREICLKFWEKNNRDLTAFFSSLSRNFLPQLEKSLDKDKSFFAGLRGGEIILSLRKEISDFLKNDFFMAEEKILGQAAGEIFTLYQKNRDNISFSLEGIPFLSLLEKRNLFLEIEKRIKLADIVFGLGDRQEVDYFEKKEAKSCFDDLSSRMESKIKTQKELFEKVGGEEIIGRLKEAKERFAGQDAEKACFLLREAETLSNLLEEKKIFSDSAKFRDGFIDYAGQKLKERENILKDYDKEKFDRLYVLLEKAGFTLENIKNFSGPDEFERFLSENVRFWAWLRNFDLGLEAGEKELLSVEKNNQFSLWCWENRGVLLENLALWPDCVLFGGRRVSLFEWYSLENK